MPPSRQRSCTHDDGHPRGLIPRSHLPSPGAVRFFDVHSFDGAAPQKQCGVIHLAGFVLDCVLLSRLVQSIVRNISKLDGLAQRCEDRGRSWRRGWRRGREVFTTGWIAIRGKAGLALAHFYHVPDVPYQPDRSPRKLVASLNMANMVVTPLTSQPERSPLKSVASLNM